MLMLNNLLYKILGGYRVK